MKKLFSIFMLAFAISVVLFSCKEDEIAFTLKALKADAIDLNGATAAANVVANTAITAEFSKDVDATSVTVTLVQDYDDANITVEVVVNGKIVTVTPEGMGSGTLYILNISAVKSTDGDNLPAMTRNFTTVGSFVPAGLFAYWPFDGDPNDAIGTFDPTASGVVAITYGADRKGVASKAATFDGDASIIEIPNGDQLINASNFTLSFWMKLNSTHDAGHFVMGLGAYYGLQYEVSGGYDGSKFAIRYALADGTTTSEDFGMPNMEKDNTNGGWQGCDFAKQITADDYKLMLKDKWVQVVYTYDGADKRVTTYFNGEKIKSSDFDLWPEGDAKTTITGLKYGGTEPDVKNEWAFGFIQSRAGTMWDAEGWGGYDIPTANHFKGSLDEVRIFHKALSSQEVELLYNSEK